MTSSSSPRDKLIAKLRALRAKTQDNGCSEHEALAAASLAARLQHEWEISEADLIAAGQQPAYDIGRDDIDIKFTKQTPPVYAIVPALNKLTRCRTLQVRDNPYSRKVYGDKPDRELWYYLYDMVRFSMDAEHLRHALWDLDLDDIAPKSHGQRKRDKNDFCLGMAHRISERLEAMAEERDKTFDLRQDGGTALVLVGTKITMRDELYHKENPRTYAGRDYGRVSSLSQFEAGKAAGDRVSLAKGVAGGGGNLRIGRS